MSNVESLVGEMVLAADDEAGLVVTFNLSATFNSYRIEGGEWEPLDCKTREVAGSMDKAKEFAVSWLAEMVNGTED